MKSDDTLKQSPSATLLHHNQKAQSRYGRSKSKVEKGCNATMARWKAEEWPWDKKKPWLSIQPSDAEAWL